MGSRDMNYKYFGHHHLLIPLKLDQGERLSCKTCDRLIVDELIDPFHGCLSCDFYVHDHCISNTPRSLTHSSHPPHPLTLLPIPTYPTGSYSCDACGSQGSGFSYSCAHCEFDLHINCASLPTTTLLNIHPHELRLVFDFPGKEGKGMFPCGACAGAVEPGRWVYYCDDCDFGTHVYCVATNQRMEMNRGGSDDHQAVENSNGRSGTEEGLGPFKQAVNEMMENQLFLMRMQNQMERDHMIMRLTRWEAYKPN